MLTAEQVKTHWWRAAVAVAAVAVVTFSRDDPFAGLFALVPILVWCAAARSGRAGVVTGLVLLALLAWFVLPRELGLAGPWVPAAIEVYWLHTTLAAVVCAIGSRKPGPWLLPAFGGFVVTGGVLVAGWQEAPSDEGVLPGPAQLRIIEDIDCGSGGCWRVAESTGDHAAEVWQAHLTARNFTPAPALDGVTRFCRTTGLLVNHQTCAEVRPLAPDSARVEWYVE
ncbi:hypothetical protein [Amycolatopsis vancoresmycina]|uniref:Uncharacterized protein n=1 Tax=Amycolatopsis vancoresmycina DSM 44592 TaxID=1292037 RepID=R1HX91_9PSEU|nr:hypothetical protein [Amycolatopsis vancoresmycina]EOD64936.1 hypothetical protein H480_29286 [Amycolatopsis vancoresmycina DSM 44592]